ARSPTVASRLFRRDAIPTEWNLIASHAGAGGPMTRATRLGLMCLLAVAMSLTAADAKESNGTPAAKVFFAQGDALAKAGKPAEAAAAFRKAIDADPDYVDAHQRFIESTQRAEMPATRTPVVPRLEALYARWAKQHPNRAVYQWALGFLATDPAKADRLFAAALEIDPAFARAH